MSSASTARASAAVSPTAALVVAVFAISWAGPLVRFASAPALAISAWRLLLSVAFIAVVLVIRRTPLPRLSIRDWLFAAVAGIFLALHFLSWIASLGLTTVSSSVVLVSTQPVFVAFLSGALLGESATRRQWLGIAVAVGGAAIIAWGDFGLGPRAILGDALALAGALFVSIYYVIGRRLRRDLDLWWYILLVYGIAALVLVLAIGVMPDVPLTGFPRRDWVIFAALAAGPMMLGHTAVNYALRYLRAYVANLALLTEPIGATLIAWLLPAIAEVPGPQVVVGGALILGGIAVTVLGREAAATPGPEHA
ncbi:MAG TPA: DMT family transporter [Longimicrobiales bacterium]|nr:DMT family transporter [Longimicrobiales bacterium]